jgi:hypothetical protein
LVIRYAKDIHSHAGLKKAPNIYNCSAIARRRILWKQDPTFRGWNRLRMLFPADEQLSSAIRELVIHPAVMNYLQVMRSTELITCDITSSELGYGVAETKEEQERHKREI